MNQGFDQTAKKVLSVLLRSLLVQFNGLSGAQVSFVTKKNGNEELDKQLEQIYGSPCLLGKADKVLQSFNQKLMQESCLKVFCQSPISFDGSSLIKKYGEFHSLFLSMQQPLVTEQLQVELNQGLWQVCPLIDEQKRMQVIKELMDTCQRFITREVNIQNFHTKYLAIVKEVQANK
jgi:hypothetical protein